MQRTPLSLIGPKKLLLNVRQISQEEGLPELILVAMADITDK